MWTCPKCGRAFKRQEQSHYCGKAPETVDEYIACRLIGRGIISSSLPVSKTMWACIRGRRLSGSFPSV